jgi:DHA2 family metal-tetracycline-proton antiporter-like MFS transporter
MFSLDYSMVNISLPSISRYFGCTISAVSRVPLAYLLVVTSTALLFGKLGDIIGFKKIFLAGLAIFTSGTFLCVFAPSLNALLAFRIYQCVGEAMFSPIGIAIATVFLPANMRGRALGFMATAQGLGFCLGPVIGGYVNAHFGWHGVFLINIPIGLLLIAATLKAVPSEQPLLEDKRIDYRGALFIFVCLSTLVYALNSIAGAGLKNPVVLGCFAVSAVSLALFIIHESRAPNPILYLPLFSGRDFVFATASAFCVVFVYLGIIFLFPFYLSYVRGIDVMHAGFVLMIPALMVIIFAPVAGFVSDRFGARPVCTLGVSITTLAFLWFSFFNIATPMAQVIAALSLAGIAIGCFLPANNKLVMALAPDDKQGMASAIYKILNSTGGVFGIAILPLIIMSKASALAALKGINLKDIKLHPEMIAAGFDSAFKFAMFVCVAGVVLAALAKDPHPRDGGKRT